MRVTASMLDREVRIERPIAAGPGPRSAGKGTWELVDEDWANIQNALPSRSEKTDGIASATRRARVRMRFRDDITSAMRLVEGERVMQIVAGPVEIGRRDGIEMMVEDYSAAGNNA